MELSMTRDTGASRTFQSLFPHEKCTRVNTCGSSTEQDARTGETEEEEELLWDEGEEEEAEEEDNNHPKHISTVGVAGATEAAAADLPRSGIEAWAEDDDEEDEWKDVLEARVDQLELAVPNNNPSTASTRLNPAKKTSSRSTDGGPYHSARGARSSLLTGPRGRAAARVGQLDPRESAIRSEPSSKTSSHIRKRTSSADYNGPSTKAPTVKRASRIPGATRIDSEQRVAGSTAGHGSMVALTRSVSDGGPSLPVSKASSRPTLERSTQGQKSSGAPVARSSYFALSDAESIRRHVLSDIKRMSIERIVADVRRLHHLDELSRDHNSENAALCEPSVIREQLPSSSQPPSRQSSS